MDNKTCVECKVEFKPKNSKAIFCSNKCRQKDYRRKMMALVEIGKNIKPDSILASGFTFVDVPKKEITIIPSKADLEKMADKNNIHPKSLNQPKVIKEDISKLIADIKAEKIPKERDTPIGRRAWLNDQQKRILELKKTS